MEWGNSKERFVAFFDIMGFKSLVQTHSHEEIIELMTKLSNIVKDMDNSRFGESDDDNIKTSIFSDSIVIITNTDSITSAVHLMLSSAWLFKKCIELGIPFKRKYCLWKIYR